MPRRFVALALLLVLTLASIGCQRLDRETYDRVERGMTYDQVVAILGQPDEMSSGRVGPVSGTSATWQNETLRIDIQFVNDKVQLKTFKKLP